MVDSIKERLKQDRPKRKKLGSSVDNIIRNSLKKERRILVENPNQDNLSERIRKELENNRDVNSLHRLAKHNLKIKKVRKEKEGHLKAILAFDTTDSMGQYRNKIKKDLNYLVETFDEMLDKYELAIMGCGDHYDDNKCLQINPYSQDVHEIKNQISGIVNTSGGDIPEAFECLFHKLNTDYPISSDTSLILLTDSIPHNMKGYNKFWFFDYDYGCPFNINYETELKNLKTQIKGFYIISYTKNRKIKELQRTLVDHDKYIIDIRNIENLPNLVMGICMSEVGRLDYLMRQME